jgi:hypothetical protein
MEKKFLRNQPMQPPKVDYRASKKEIKMKLQVSVSDAIEKAEKSAKRWEEKEKMGKAYGFAQIHGRVASNLKSFKAELEENRNNPAYVCKDVSGYVDVLQNLLFHTSTSQEAKKRIAEVRDGLNMLIYLLDNIDIVP